MNQSSLLLAVFLAASMIACDTSTGEASISHSARGPEAELEQTGSPTSQITEITFDDVEVGGLPAGWKVEATHPKGRHADWSVQKDATAPSADKVLALEINDYNRGTFNLCWTNQSSFQNGIVEVKVKAREGSVDRGGGPIWRVQDKDNYYIARWNPLEDNFRVYYVKESRRVQLGSATAKLPADQWHTITVHHQGDQILAYLNGEKLLELSDSTFPGVGGVGVWTKADAASSFDDLRIQDK